MAGKMMSDRSASRPPLRAFSSPVLLSATLQMSLKLASKSRLLVPNAVGGDGGRCNLLVHRTEMSTPGLSQSLAEQCSIFLSNINEKDCMK